MFPKANWPTVMNIAKSLLAVEPFYTQTCNLMKSFLLPLPFVDSKPEIEKKPKPNFIFHTILEFICAKISQILENDCLSTLSLEAVSEILNYFKEKQIKEQKENSKLMKKSLKNDFLLRIAELDLKLASLQDLQKENSKIVKYQESLKRGPSISYDAGPSKKRFVIEDPSTEYCYTDLSEFSDYFNFSSEKLPSSMTISKQDLKSQCLPVSSIPSQLLSKCKNELPSPSLFLFNMPKKITKEEISKLLTCFYSDHDLYEKNAKIEILQGRLKGQGFLHVESIEKASEIRDTLFGFPLLGKPLILVMFIQQFSRNKKE